MIKYFSLNTKTLLFALASWVVPFVASVPFINPETGEINVNPILFHLVLFIIFFALVYFLFKKLQKQNLFNLQTVNTFFIVNVILDLIILVILLAVPFGEWLTTILPAYIVGIYGLYYLISKNKI